MERVHRGMTARTTSIIADCREGAPSRRFNWGRVTGALDPYLQVAPLTLTFAVFLLIPIATIVVVSFWDYDSIRVIPDFILLNYEELLTSPVTWRTYLNTLKYAALTWVLTLGIGFTVAYFVAFHVKSLTWQITLFMICTIPFWTSNIIRMISWIPFLGRNGILNSTLMAMGVIDQPLEFLLFSDFSVVLAFVHLYVLFMVVPIFNSMMRSERALIEAAVDAGATGWQVLTNVIIPLSKPGIAIGSIFVVTIVMGDFITFGVMGGQQIASAGKAIETRLNALQFPPAAANAVILLGATMIIIAVMNRIVDIRKEL